MPRQGCLLRSPVVRLMCRTIPATGWKACRRARRAAALFLGPDGQAERSDALSAGEKPRERASCARRGMDPDHLKIGRRKAGALGAFKISVCFLRSQYFAATRLRAGLLATRPSKKEMDIGCSYLTYQPRRSRNGRQGRRHERAMRC